MTKTRTIIVLAMALLLAGCSGTPTLQPPETKTGAPSHTPVTSTATASVYPTFTSTVKFPLIPTEILEIPTVTSTTSTPETPTWTPLPTLPLDMAKKVVQDLLDNNAGCKLPCWWGITPGQTSWQEAQQYLSRIALAISSAKNDDYLSASVYVPTPRQVDYANYLEQHYIIRDGIVETIRVYNYDFAPVYNLAEILNTYGKPEEVLMSAYYEPRLSVYYWASALFYPQQGLMVLYSDGKTEIKEDKVRNYPQKARYPFLYLWSPDLGLDVSKSAEEFLDTMNWPPYRTLKDATGMDVDTFYMVFKDPNTPRWLETPANLWPGP